MKAFKDWCNGIDGDFKVSVQPLCGTRPPPVVYTYTSGGASYISTGVSKRLYWARPERVTNRNSVLLGS